MSLLLFYLRFRPVIALNRSHCPLCTHQIGLAAARAASQTYRATCKDEFAALQRQAGGTAFVDFDGQWPLVCLCCRCRLEFDELMGSLEGES